MRKYKSLKRITILASYFVIGILAINSCSAPPIFNAKINDKNNTNNSKNEISIITYNIQTVFGKGENKVIGLTNYLSSEKYDFVQMQEVFDEKARNYFVENLDGSFYHGQISRVDYGSFPSNICQDAGLFSYSRFPIVDLSRYDFGENTDQTGGAIHQMLIKEFALTFDFLANKSVLGSLHQINDTTKMFMFTTHLQAISSRRHRTTQLKQIQAFIENAVITIMKNKVVENPENLIVILTGDFNYDAYEEGDVETLQKFLGKPRDLHREFNKDRQEYSMVFSLLRFYKRFDFIFAYDQIGEIPLKKVEVKSINITDVHDDQGNSLSDHLALKALLKVD